MVFWSGLEKPSVTQGVTINRHAFRLFLRSANDLAVERERTLRLRERATCSTPETSIPSAATKLGCVCVVAGIGDS